MKKVMVASMGVGLAVLLLFTIVSCGSGKDEAKSLVKKAAAYAKYQGKEKAIAEINKPRGMFDKGELYVFAYDLNGVMLAHPKNPELIGKNLIAVPDSEGKLFRKEIVEKAKTKGSGWVNYVYLNPERNVLEQKTTYFQKEGEMIICCGAYREYSHEGD